MSTNLTFNLSTVCTRPAAAASASRITGHTLGSLRNVAVTLFTSSPVIVLATSADVPLPSQGPEAGFPCMSNHQVVLVVLDRETKRCKSRHRVELPSLLPDRPCADLLNFRGRGPEDPRLLPLWRGPAGENLVLVLVNEYWPSAGRAPSAQLGFDRRVVAYVLSAGSMLNHCSAPSVPASCAGT